MSTDEPRTAITLRDVAERAGVSISTASRALTGTRKVHPELIERVENAASDLGYRPNEAARSLRMARTMTFGVVFNRLESPMMLDLLDGLNAGSADREYTLLVTSARDDTAVYRRLIRRLFDRRVDGLLLSFPGDVDRELASYRVAGTPVIAFVGRQPGAESIPVVRANGVPGRQTMIDRLAELGHRHIAAVGRQAAVLGDEMKRMGADQGVEVTLRPFGISETPDDFAAAVRELATGEDPATAFIIDYGWSAQITGRLNDLGLRVPDDVSVVTFSDSRASHGLVHPPLAAIEVDTHEIGRHAAQLLANAIDGEEPPSLSSLDVTRFVERSSIGPVRLDRAAR